MADTTTVQTPRALLPKWANEQDGWCRTIAADVLKNRQPSGTDVDRYLKLLLAEKKLSDEAFEPVAKIEEKELTGNPLDPLRLDSLKIGDGINALQSGSEIEFSPSITVIFGENGSGKSGFVRVLKRAAGVRTAEEILHNVRGDKKPTPSATFQLSVNGKASVVSWKNEFGLSPLNRISIFDARGARVHVEDDLTYVYTPGELTLFPLVQSGIEHVRAAFEAAITKRTPGTNTILASFDRACSIYLTIETLGAATDLEEIKKFAVLPQDADATIEALTLEIDALQSQNIQTELRRARDRAQIVANVSAALATAAAFDQAAFLQHVQARNAAAERQEQAGNKAFDGAGIPGILTPEWRRFIQAGEEYLRAHLPAGYPAAPDDCAYCGQPLQEAALDLVKKYRDFSNNEIKAALDVAEADLTNYAAAILAVPTDTLRKQLADEISGGVDTLTAVLPLVDRIATLQGQVRSGLPPEWEEKSADVSAAEGVVAQEQLRLAQLTAGLQASVEERQTTLKAKQAELTELKGKKTASALMPQIEKRVLDAKWVSRANIVKNNLPTLLRTLTETAKEASEELLNKDFGRRFENECQKLRAPNVTLNFPGRQGQVTRRKLLASYKPSDVLSEGEQKALALADFLAEVTSVPAASPVVFDDPITSMDYRRLNEVCDRIVALSADHQILVFTHNIWFAAKLLGDGDKKTMKYYDIRHEGGDAGIVTAASHPRVDTIAKVSGSLKQLIEHAEKAEGEVRSALVEKGYEKLRNLCELVVEVEMLKGVVQRYEPNVMMTKLDKINVEKFSDSLATIVPTFEKSCRYIASHSQPVETQGIRPTLEELKKDFEAVVAARQPHKD